MQETDRIKFIEYNGNKILYVNHQNLIGDDLGNHITKAADFMSELDKSVLLLIDFRNVKAFGNVRTILESSKIVKVMFDKAIKTALIRKSGFTGTFVLVFKNVCNVNLESFDDEINAKNWLVQ